MNPADSDEYGKSGTWLSDSLWHPQRSKTSRYSPNTAHSEFCFSSLNAFNALSDLILICPSTRHIANHSACRIKPHTSGLLSRPALRGIVFGQPRWTHSQSSCRKGNNVDRHRMWCTGRYSTFSVTLMSDSDLWPWLDRRLALLDYTCTLLLTKLNDAIDDIENVDCPNPQNINSQRSYIHRPQSGRLPPSCY